LGCCHRQTPASLFLNFPVVFILTHKLFSSRALCVSKQRAISVSTSASIPPLDRVSCHGSHLIVISTKRTEEGRPSLYIAHFLWLSHGIPLEVLWSRLQNMEHGFHGHDELSTTENSREGRKSLWAFDSRSTGHSGVYLLLFR